MYSSRFPPSYLPPPFPTYDYRPSPYLDYINRSHFAYPASNYFRRSLIEAPPILPPISYRPPPHPYYYRDWDDEYFNRPPPPPYFYSKYHHSSVLPPPPPPPPPPLPPFYEPYIPPPNYSSIIRDPYAPPYGPPPYLMRESVRLQNPNEIKPWESTRSGKNKSSKILKKRKKSKWFRSLIVFLKAEIKKESLKKRH